MEFELIEQFFKPQQVKRQDVALGIGDDCALLTVPADHQLAVSIDTLVAGIHFWENADPVDLGHKALAVNLSDLAAMGATPAWFTLALTLPQPDTAWLTKFCQGLFALARQYQVQLVGGDTTRGPLCITIQVHGFIPRGQAILRSGARPGDLVFVTGCLGDAGLALQLRAAAPPSLQQKLHRPEPRIREGLLLRQLANSAIDISDGLAADLSHILSTSGVGATIQLEQLPLSTALLTHTDRPSAQMLALTAGDDYELCFTLPAEKSLLLEQSGIAATCIGVVEAQPGLRIVNASGEAIILEKAGYQHF